MKKLTVAATIAIMILAMVFSTALAAKSPADVSVTVKNHTGGTVTLRLTGETGSYWFTFDDLGMYKISVPEGRYSYYANTPCGNESGDFNLNVHKFLKFACKNSGREITLTKTSCEKVLWVGSYWQWFELNPDWWPILLADPFYEAEMKCFDADLPSNFESSPWQ
jgi:hypothetical protein